MTTLNLAGYPTDTTRLAWERDHIFATPHDLMAFFGRVGATYLETTPGRVVSEQLWPALGGGESDVDWTPPSPTVAITLSHLTRKDLSSLARLLDEFARAYPDAAVIRRFVAAIVAEDAAANPGSGRLFDA